MSSSGGSAAIREAIEARRAKIVTPGTSLKMLNKNAERMKAWWKEEIRFAFLDEHGEPKPECAWKVPRHELSSTLLQKMCSSCPMHSKIEYLKDQFSGDIVWPADAQMQCQSTPSSYAVIAVEERSVVDRLKDSGYYGDVQAMMFNVPLKTVDNETEVSPEDIKAWLLTGLQEEDEEVKEAQEIIRALEEEASKVEHSLSRVGYMKFEEKSSFGKGKEGTLTEEVKAAKRKEFHEALSAQRQNMEEELNEARTVLARIEEQRKATAVDVELASVEPNCGTCTYYISFPGYQGSRLEDVLCAKTDWPGINLATKHDGLPPWAGRGQIPDGSKSYIPSYIDYAVNMRAARICRLQHGFGQYKVARTRKADNNASDSLAPRVDSSVVSTTPKTAQFYSPMASDSPPGSGKNAKFTEKAPEADGFKVTDGGKKGKPSDAPSGLSSVGDKEEEKSNDAGVPFAGEAFSFYHGEYKEGLRSGFGTEITDTGVYIGEYSADRRSGAGELLFANGDYIEGNFASETRFPEAGNSTNPYKEGVPSGLVEIRFASGATYKGEMKQGRITGKGDYISSLGERLSGDFVDGRLHGTGSVVDVVGQTWSGQWRAGEMNGEGRHSSPEVGEFEGDWVRGELQGKGRILFKGGNTYEGFFMDHCRSGPGTLLRGNVKSVYDPRSGRSVLRSNRVYEGNWRASELRPGSTVTLTRRGTTSCLGRNEAGWYNRPIVRIKRREQQVRHRLVESVDFYTKYEAISRQQVEAKKSRLYSKQAKLANQDLINDHFKKLTADDVKAEHLRRAINLENVMRITGNHIMTGTGSIAKGAEKLHQIAVARGNSSNTTLLCTLMQSRFEEAQELQQLVDMPDAAAAAEALANAQQADINY